MKEIISFLMIIIVSIISIFVSGLCISLMWGWFISPVFNTRPISVYESVGISLFLSALLYPIVSKNNTKGDESLSQLASLYFGKYVLFPLIYLFLSYVWYEMFIYTA